MVGIFAAESKKDMPSNPCNYDFNTTLIDCLINVIYKGLQRLEISNVNLAGTLTCLYGDISNHYSLNLGYCFSV